MRYYTLILSLSFLFHNVGQSQELRFGNEWLNVTQTYFRLAVAQDGIYQISYQTLKNAGLPMDTLRGSQFQVFHRGQQIGIYRSTMGLFSAQDYLEFYGQKRTGAADSLLYESANAMPHPHHSLFSDTTYYFLTFSNLKSYDIPLNKIIIPQKYAFESHHHTTDRYIYADEFSFNTFTGPIPTFQLSTFDRGEAMTGKRRTTDSIYVQNYPFERPTKLENEVISIKVILNGRNTSKKKVTINLSLNDGTNHNDTIALDGFEHQILEKNILLNKAINSLQLSTKALNNGSPNFYSLSLLELKYPQTFAYENASKVYNLIRNPANVSLLQIPLASPQNQHWLYDITDKTRPIKLHYETKNAALEAVVPNTATERTLFLTHQVLPITKLEKVLFTPINSASHNYIIIAHPKLWSAAQAYQTYRSSAAGGNYQTLLLNILDVYNWFNFGEHSPTAIRRLADYLGQDAAKDKFLLLIGKAHSSFEARPRLSELDLVPTVGYPGSDALLTSGLGKMPAHVPALLTGRIPATTPVQVLNLLNKIKQHESSPVENWRKNVLHLSGGLNAFEIEYMKAVMQEIGDSATQQYVGGRFRAMAKPSTNPVEEAPVAPFVNEGVGLLSFLGHSSPISTDFNVGDVSDPSRGYNQKQRYPVLFFNGCSYTNTFRDVRSQASNWLFSANAGAVGVLGHSHQNDLNAIVRYMKFFYGLQFHDASFFYQPLGKIWQQAAAQMAKTPLSFTDVVNLQEMLLLGDPALRLFPIEKPDYQIKQVFVESAANGQPLANSPAWKVGVVVNNNGKFDPASQQNYGLNIQTKTANLFVVKPFANTDTLYFTVKNDFDAGAATLQIVIDSKNEVAELDENNNATTLKIDAQSLNQTSVFPLNSTPDRISPLLEVLINGQTPQQPVVIAKEALFEFNLKDDRPLISATDTASLSISIRKICDNCQFQDFKKQLVTPQKNNALTWFQAPKLAVGNYEMTLQASDLSGNNALKTTALLSFKVVETELNAQPLIAYPNPFGRYVIFKTQNGQALPFEKINIEIFDLNGKLIAQMQQLLLYPENSIYWKPPVYLPAQKLVYRAVLENKQIIQTVTGNLQHVE